MESVTIRPEERRDQAAVHAVHAAAFPTPAEANLVEALRAAARPLVSLVAEVDGAVAGHVLFTPVVLPALPGLRMLGLAPLAVLPQHQRRGIGSQLVTSGLERCRALGTEAVVVLGHPHYYPRFGFEPSTGFGFRSVYPVRDDVFLALELRPGSLRGASGTAHYHAAFDALG